MRAIRVVRRLLVFIAMMRAVWHVLRGRCRYCGTGRCAGTEGLLCAEQHYQNSRYEDSWQTH